MHNSRFDGIRERLLRGGVAPRHVRRTLQELEDHFTDLVARSCKPTQCGWRHCSLPAWAVSSRPAAEPPSHGR
jgi:hypothetical protein